jgi:Acetyltransferase (GNAT) domain
LHFVRHPDRAAWAALHAATPQATVYTTAWWLDLVTGGRWGAVVEPSATGGYTAALPVPYRRRWRGLGPSEFYQPFFTQQLGVLSLAEEAPEAGPFLAALPDGVRTYGQLHYANRLTAAPGFQMTERLTHHLDLQAAYPALAARFHQNHRRNLKKAAALTFTQEVGAASAVVELFRQTKGAELPEVKPRHYALLLQLTEALAARGQLMVWVGRSVPDGPLLAGGLFAHDAHQLIYLLGGVSELGRAQGAMHGVVDALLRHEAGSGRLLDFEGSMVPSVARFYAGFGAQPIAYPAFARP